VNDAVPTGPPGILPELALDHWIDGELSHGRAPIVPGLRVPGTMLPRIGALALMADIIAGQPPMGAITPTTDISVHLGRLQPMASVHLVSRVRKAGRLLVVCEVHLMADDETEPFALCLSTFMNRLLPRVGPGARPQAPALSQPLDRRIGARVHAPGTVELAPSPDLNNDHHGTILGGVMAILAELAAESLFVATGPVVVTDLDVRFLNRVKVGPAVAVARALTTGPQGTDVAIEIVDSGDDDRLAVFATARVVPAPAS
jgi:acyl-coenzyme A thioesterase PaaI-like protein